MRFASVPRLRSGYSRIPVHETGRPLAFQGLLLVKKVRAGNLLCVDSVKPYFPS